MNHHQTRRAIVSGLLRLCWLPVFLCGIGLSTTAIVWHTWHQQRLQTAQDELHSIVTKVRTRIETRVDANKQILRGVVGLFVVNPAITRVQFHTYVEALRITIHYPGIQGIGFARFITPEQLTTHEQQMRAEGFSHYAVRPAGQRAIYSAIVYLEPFDWRNQRAFGYDMYSEPVRQAAMRYAWEQASPAVSGKVQLVQETSHNVQAGFLIYVPIYHSGTGEQLTVAQRQTQLLGWAYSPLRVKDLMDNLLERDYPELAHRIALTLYDGATMTPAALLFQSASHTLLTTNHLTVTQTVALGHRVWTLHAQSLPAFDAATHQFGLQDVVIVVTGGSFSIMLAIFTWGLLRSHQRVVAAWQQTAMAHHELLEKQQQLRLIFDASDVAIFLANVHGTITRANVRMADMFRCPFGELIGSAYLSYVHSSYYEDAQQMLHELCTQRAIDRKIECRYCTRDGHTFWGQISGHLIQTETKKPLGVVGVIVDITHRHETEAHIQFLAHHDYLTGLPNRILFAERVAQALTLAQRYQRQLGILFIDLNDFKPVNDNYGHQVGDELLCAVAQRLQQHVRASDTICRQGGDEFVILVPELSSVDTLLQLQQILVSVVSQPYVLSAQCITITASIGHAIYPQHGRTVESLLHHADLAMYQLKQARRAAPIAQ